MAATLTTRTVYTLCTFYTDKNSRVEHKERRDLTPIGNKGSVWPRHPLA